MGIKVTDNTVLVDGAEVDIYDALDLRSALLELYEKGFKEVVLDLSKVEYLSTSAIQVILSARETFAGVKLPEGSLRPPVVEDLDILNCKISG